MGKKDLDFLFCDYADATPTISYSWYLFQTLVDCICTHLFLDNLFYYIALYVYF